MYRAIYRTCVFFRDVGFRAVAFRVAGFRVSLSRPPEGLQAYIIPFRLLFAGPVHFRVACFRFEWCPKCTHFRPESL